MGMSSDPGCKASLEFTQLEPGVILVRVLRVGFQANSIPRMLRRLLPVKHSEALL